VSQILYSLLFTLKN